MQHRFEQAAAVALDGGELGFQLIAERHQFIVHQGTQVIAGLAAPGGLF